LADELLFGKLSHGGHVRISAGKEGLVFGFDEVEETLTES